ncbi:MAG: dihydrofolate reductase [Alphaproteobacteria bacterium CG_4_10_14_0_2_um_filter_63_37]|nr:MAG: hypothetical protein AUJ55_11465 [Proteobacteria bacterium CG1_02_64_396]PJA24348.1 MAG: dihydrofolate reductase [Alphaproteobacteria bacterium CG_4_10_14_0_2_um_filter_63_37]
MRKVILYIATSLDGFIAGPQRQLDWLFNDQDYGYTEFYKGIDTILMGRITYEDILGFGDWPFDGVQTLVFSHTFHGGGNGVRFTREPPASVVQRLKSQPGKHIWLGGGGKLVADFHKADLIDEMVISIHPIVLGEGIPLFPPTGIRRDFKLLGVEGFDSGLVQMRYGRG